MSGCGRRTVLAWLVFVFEDEAQLVIDAVLLGELLSVFEWNPGA